MAHRLTMLPKDLRYCPLHLRHVLFRAGIERLLHDRLLGATCSPEGTLQRLIRSDAGVDLAESVSAGEDGDEGVLQLLYRLMPHRLLQDADFLRDGVEELERFDLG